MVEEQAQSLLRAGHRTHGHDTDPDQVAIHRTLPNLVVNEAVTASTGVARMNITQKPFDDIRVRRALNMAVNKEEIVKAYYNGNAELFAYPGFWRMAARYWRMGFYELYRSLSKAAFVRALQRLVPAVLHSVFCQFAEVPGGGVIDQRVHLRLYA